MALPLSPPLPPMLARLTRELPLDGYLYEPKWDGFRCLVFRDGDDVDLRSRHGRPLARYFPELVAALRALPDAAALVAFDCLAASGADLRERPFVERREVLAAVMADVRRPLHLTPQTTDPEVA